jgi:DNA-binding MarR family transcriptional regulator
MSTLTPTQQTVIDAVSTHGPVPAARVAELTGLAYSTVTALLRKLADAGHVHRDQSNEWTTPSQPTASDRDSGQAANHTGTASATVTPDNSAHTDWQQSEATANTEPDQTTPSPDTAAPQDQADDPEHVHAPSDVDGHNGDSETATSHGPDKPNPDYATSTPRRPYRRSGKPPRARGQLRQEVLAYLTAQPGQELTPHQIAKHIDASDGAVSNACSKLAHNGDVQRVEGDKAAFVYKPAEKTS